MWQIFVKRYQICSAIFENDFIEIKFFKNHQLDTHKNEN